MPRKAKTVEPTVTQVATGETAMSKAIREAYARIGQSFTTTPAIAKVLDQALTFLAGRNDIMKAVATHGPENLFRVFSELAVNDEVTAMNAIRTLMRQLVSDVHFRWRSIYRKQMLAARANGGGVDGFELSVGEIMDEYGSYPGSDDDVCSPAEQTEIVQDLHALLNSAFQVCDAARMYWLDDYQVQDLPYLTYQDDDGSFISLHSFEEAMAYLDRRAEQTVSRRKDRATAAIKAISNLRLTA